LSLEFHIECVGEAVVLNLTIKPEANGLSDQAQVLRLQLQLCYLGLEADSIDCRQLSVERTAILGQATRDWTIVVSYCVVRTQGQPIAAV
jgi:hypothetical protein